MHTGRPPGEANNIGKRMSQKDKSKKITGTDEKPGKTTQGIRLDKDKDVIWHRPEVAGGWSGEDCARRNTLGRSRQSQKLETSP